MVQVTAPAGWQPPAAGVSAPPAAAVGGATSASGRRRWENELKPGERALPGSAITPSGSGGLSSSDISSSGSVTGTEPTASIDSGEPMHPDGSATATIMQRLFAARWTKWAVLSILPASIVAVAAGTWLSRPATEVVEEPPSVVDVTSPAMSPQAEEQAAPPIEPSAEPEPLRLARRWIPTETQAVVSLRPKLLLSQPAARVVLDRTAALWQPALDRLAIALGMAPQSLERATWSSTDLGDLTQDDWLTTAVVVIEADQAVDALLPANQTLGWKLDRSVVRKLKSPDWPHPFALIDKRTIVTGPEAQLRELAERKEHRLANAALGQLLDVLDARSAGISAVDLRALRDAEALPHWLPLVDVLHAEADDWNLLRAMPLALGLALRLDEKIDVEIDLACDGQSSVEQVQAALDRVLNKVDETIGSEADGLTGKLLAGQIKASVAGELKHFLAGSQSALAGRDSGLTDSIAWVRLAWQGNLPKLASAFLTSIPPLETNRLATARRLDEDHHRRLLEGLEGYIKAEGAFPAGAGGAALLPPENRLSWQATLLPYYGHLDWHGELNFSRAWNDAINQRVTKRPLELMVNPAMGVGTTKAGFPVTHYVGMAGLGADAGQLDAADARAGVFGFRARLAPAKIPDGASNTIALAGVSGKLGPWAAGGGATVRGLTQRPYINGPDGFGSGQPDGMLVGMADGSVRFLAKDTDPEVLERLATIGSGDSPAASVAAVKSPALKEMSAKPAADKATAAPKPARKPLQTNIAKHLNDRIAAIELKDNTTLSDLADLLSQLSSVPITLDADGLAAAGVDADATVSLRLSNATIGEILDEALRPYGLKYIPVGDQLIITNGQPAADALETTTFQVDDLAASAEPSDEKLARWIETFVVPTAWQSSGGAGTVAGSRGSVTIEQTPEVTAQVADFLDKLRIARELPISRREGRRLSLATHWARARDKLAGRVTANFAEPTPLKEIAAHLQEVSGMQIVFDGLALAEASHSPADRGKLSANEAPLSEALERLLEPLKLGYRAVNGQTLEITSHRDLADELELELYPAKPLLPADAGPGDLDQLSARIRSEVLPSSWREQGGSGVLAIDPSSSYLIVLAAQPAQRELERWLEEQASK
jgi:hypothetical protein